MGFSRPFIPQHMSHIYCTTWDSSYFYHVVKIPSDLLCVSASACGLWTRDFWAGMEGVCFLLHWDFLLWFWTMCIHVRWCIVCLWKINRGKCQYGCYTVTSASSFNIFKQMTSERRTHAYTQSVMWFRFRADDAQWCKTVRPLHISSINPQWKSSWELMKNVCGKLWCILGNGFGPSVSCGSQV